MKRCYTDNSPQCTALMTSPSETHAHLLLTMKMCFLLWTKKNKVHLSIILKINFYNPVYQKFNYTSFKKKKERILYQVKLCLVIEYFQPNNPCRVDLQSKEYMYIFVIYKISQHYNFYKWRVIIQYLCIIYTLYFHHLKRSLSTTKNHSTCTLFTLNVTIQAINSSASHQIAVLLYFYFTLSTADTYMLTCVDSLILPIIWDASSNGCSTYK